MDQKKKIIAITVFAVFVTAIGFYAKYAFFPSEEEEEKEFTISVPEVDEQEIDSISKMEGYDKEVVRDKYTEELLEKRQEAKEGSKYNFNPFKRPKSEEADTLDSEKPTDEFEKMRMEEQLNAKKELDLLLQMQEKMNANVTNQAPANYYQPAPQPQPVAQELPDIEPDPEPISLQERWTAQKENSNPFKGVGGFAGSSDILDLVPAETVDQGLLIEGSTVAIRLKQNLRIPESNIVVPKNSLLYGKASFDDKFRMNIDIASYKTNSKLYPVALAIYDFDGREGVHLGVNNWPKVPGKVAREVFRFVRQRGTNPAAFGGGNDIDADQVRTIALLSTINEVLEELVNRKRVFMPRKYHLWINVIKEKK